MAANAAISAPSWPLARSTQPAMTSSAKPPISVHPKALTYAEYRRTDLPQPDSLSVSMLLVVSDEETVLVIDAVELRVQVNPSWDAVLVDPDLGFALAVGLPG